MKEILKDKKLYLYLLVVITFFGIFISMNYSVDTYLLLASPKMGYIREFISSGRIITALFFLIMGVLHLPHYLMYLMSFILAITITTLTIYELNSVLEKYIKNKLLALLLPILIIINPFVIELWLFIEMGIMMLSIFACVKAYKHFDSYLLTKDKKEIKNIFIYMLLAVFSYQGTLAIFIALCAYSTIKQSKNIKEFISNNLVFLIAYIMPTIINYLFIILLGSKNRVGSNYNILKTLKVIIMSTKAQILNSFGVLPKFIFIIFILISLFIVVYYILKSKDKAKEFLSFVYLVLMLYLFTIATIIPQNADSIVVFARTTYAFGSIVALILLFSNTKENYKILVVLSILLLLIEYKSFNKIELNRYIVNYEDKQIVKQVEEKVKQYEFETGNEVKYLAVYNRENSKKFYPDLVDSFNVSSKNEDPSGLALYVYYNDRKIESIDGNEEIYNSYFRNSNWNYFSLDQIVIVDDTIHWYLY